MRIKTAHKAVKVPKRYSLKDHFFGNSFHSWGINAHTHARKALHNKTGYYYGIPQMKAS